MERHGRVCACGEKFLPKREAQAYCTKRCANAARLGDFKGRVTALGALFTYSFALGKIPVSTQWTYFHEFDVENRLSLASEGHHYSPDVLLLA